MTAPHRCSALRALAWLCSAVVSLGALACAPPPAAPVVPSAESPSGQRPTFTVSFVYEPELTLRLLRDGQPYEGEATLDLPDLTEQGADHVPLVFHQGQAEIPSDSLQRLTYKQGLSLHVGGHEVPMPQSGGTDPFACAQSINAVRIESPCTLVPPAAGAPLDHCDMVGQSSWEKARERLAEQAVACWSTLDAPTLKRLSESKDPPVTAFACQRLIEAVGQEPPTEQGIKLLPKCLYYFLPATRHRLDEAYTRQRLPEAFVEAQQGTSEQMRSFYRLYRATAPEEAEKIRALAEQRFGPPDRKRWLALRALIEAQRSGPWRATLCDVDQITVSVAILQTTPPRYSTSAIDRPLLGEVIRSPRYRKEDNEYDLLQQRLYGLLKARTGAEPSIVRGICPRGLHWYLAEIP